MDSSFNFIVRANEYLDTIQTPKTLEEIKSHIEELEDLKKEMVSRGFSNPALKSVNLSGELSNEESTDLKKQLSILNYYNYLKRITLKRVNIALSSFLISKQFIKTNPELLPYLPIEGNHIGRIIKSGRYGLNAFTRMNLLLSGKDSPQYLIARIQYEEKGKKKTKNIRIIKKDNLEERVKRDYGEKAKVLKTRVIKKPGLITSNSARTSIILSFISKTAEEVMELMDKEEKGKIKEYNEILKQNGLIPDSRIDLVEGFDNVKNKLIKNNILFKEEDILKLDEELKTELTRRNSIGNLLTEKKASNKLLLTLYKYYILNSKSSRQENNLLPTLTVEPEDFHLDVFSILEYGENKIENASKILKEKIEKEKTIKMDERIFGVSFFALKSNKPLEWCSSFFNLPKKDIEEGMEKLKVLIEEGRGKDFLEAVKDADS